MLSGWQYQTLLVLLPSRSWVLNKTILSYYLVCTRELQVLLDGHHLDMQHAFTQVSYKYCLHVFLSASQYTDCLVTTVLT